MFHPFHTSGPSAAPNLETDIAPLRSPPLDIETILEVDDLPTERDHVVAQGWPLGADIASQTWGLRGFRLRNPDGYYLYPGRGDGHGLS
jgi:hypothetical protein